MRKVYLSLLSVFALGAAMAQQSNETKVVEPASPDQKVSQRPSVLGQNKAPDDIIWSDDFSNASLWTAAGPQMDANNTWDIGSTTVGWFFGTGDNMGTVGDFARLQVEQPATITQGPLTFTYTGTIPDLTGVPAPHLEFEQYGARFITLQAVEISTDGGTNWIQVGNNDDIDPLTSGGGDVYGQPETRRFNITSAIAGNPANVSVRLYWDGAQNGPNFNYIDYGWYVDDIRIVEGHSYDAENNGGYFVSGNEMLEYYLVPTTQITGIEFSGEVTQQGGATHTGLYLQADVDNGGNVFSGTSPTVDLAASASDSLVVSTLFTPANGIGTYDITWEFFGDNADTYNANDVLTDAFDVTDYTYSRDNDIETGDISNVTSNVGGAMGIGNVMEIMADGVIGAIDIHIGDGSAGDLIFGRVDKYDSGAQDFVYESQTADHTLTAGQIGNWVKLTFANPVQVFAGDVLLVSGNHYGGDPAVAFSYAQNTFDGTVLGYVADGSLFSLLDPEAIMVRLDMRDFTSIEEAEYGFTIGQNQPNPFDNTSIINYTIEEANAVSVQFTDVAGRVVRTINQGTQAAGTYQINLNGDDFAEGVYYYTFTIGDKQVTKSMVVTK